VTRHRFAWWWGVATVLVLMGCAGTVQRSPEERFYRALRDANAVYETAMVEAGTAHASGALTDEQLERVRTIGRATASSLRTAQASLEAWLAVGQGDPALVEVALADVTRSLVELLGEVNRER
jgi:hypothetical protein